MLKIVLNGKTERVTMKATLEGAYQVDQVKDETPDRRRVSKTRRHKKIIITAMYKNCE